MQKTSIALVIAALLWPASAHAGSMEGQGRIINADGKWCWFTQAVEKKAASFLTAKGIVATMVFDDPACMAEATKEGLAFAARFNRGQIAKRIAGLVRGTWVTKDVVYDTASRYGPGMMQKAGECMVGAGKPATAIAINFVSDGSGITRVEYGHVYGCGKPL